MILKNKQEGMALVSSILVSTLIILITTTVVYKVVSGTKDVVRMKKMDAAKNIADEGLEQMVDWMNARNNPKNYSLNTAYTDTSVAATMLKNLSTSDFIAPINNLPTCTGFASCISYVTPAQGGSVYKDALNGITTFKGLEGVKLFAVVQNSTYPINELDSSSNIFYFKPAGDGTKIKGEIRVGISPVITGSANPKFDLVKVVSEAYIPSYSSTERPVSRYVALLQRPKDQTYSLDKAIISQGDILLGNGNTAAGYIPTTLAVGGGDIFTNKTLVIGAQGNVNGDAKAAQTVTNSGTVINGVVSSGQPPLPIPQLDYQTPFPINPCVGVTVGQITTLTGPCVTGPISGGNTVIMGKVYVNGSVSLAGQATVVAGSPVSMLIASGDVTVTGNGSAVQIPNHLVIATTGGNITTRGNGDVQALLVNDNPNGSVSLTGNGKVFGGVISKGSVTFSGNNATVIRDLGLNGPIFRSSPDSYLMRLLSLKELK